MGSKSVIAVMSTARPLLPRKRKSIGDLVMSQMCQERTHAAQQTKRIGLAYLTHLIGAVNTSSHRPPRTASATFYPDRCIAWIGGHGTLP